MIPIFKCKLIVEKHGIKKNSKRILKNFKTGQRFIGSSSSAQKQESILTHKLHIERLKQRLDTINHDIHIKYVFYYPKSVYFTKKGVRSKNLADLSNLIETPSDALIKAKIIQDDNLIVSLDGTRRDFIEDNNYWLEIEIFKA